MAKPEAVFIYVGTYPGKAATQADYEVLKDLHVAGAAGTYDAAVVTKDDNGAAVGALIGILFPPAFIAATAAGAAIGAVSGHLWRGMSRADCKELGDIIDDGISDHDDTAEILMSGARA